MVNCRGKALRTGGMCTHTHLWCRNVCVGGWVYVINIIINYLGKDLFKGKLKVCSADQVKEYVLVRKSFRYL